MVTKTNIKKKGKNSGYILPKDFVQRIEAEAIKKLQEANPRVNLVSLEFLDLSMSSNTANANHQIGNTNDSHSSVSIHSPNQVQDGANGSQSHKGMAFVHAVNEE